MDQHLTTATRKIRSRGWTFTKFNYAGDDVSILESILKNLNIISTLRYAICGEEICPTTGSPHLQGYIRYKSAVVQPKLEILSKAHWEPAKGTDKQNQIYCSKGGKFFEVGKISGQGKRNDLKKVQDLIREGKGMDEITLVTDKLSTIRYAEYYLRYHEEPRDWKPKVLWFFGETGTGKTRKAFEDLSCHDRSKIYVTGKNLKWWEGYDGHPYIIIDDFRADFCTFHELLRILDRYEYRIEVKGGSRQLRAKEIYITSPYAPNEVYKNRTTEDVMQLTRRIDGIAYFTNTGFRYLGDIEEHVSTDVLGNTREHPTFESILGYDTPDRWAASSTVASSTHTHPVAATPPVRGLATNYLYSANE